MRKLYFADSWNRFDFTIVIGTLIGLLLQVIVSSGPSTTKVTTVVRTFRIGRICRLVKGAEALNQLFNTLILTIPGVVNIGSLLILLYFIFSILAVQLFATVGFHGDYSSVSDCSRFLDLCDNRH